MLGAFVKISNIIDFDEFLKSIEDKLENFDIEITDDKIIVKGN